MILTREKIADIIPHAGDMCLLDRVLDWGEDSINCSSRSHQHPDNPLRRGGQLSSVHLVEYAAQSAAVHGALLARKHGHSLPPGYLAALRGVQLEVERIDDLPGDLIVFGSRLMIARPALVYEFSASNGGRQIARGRLTIVSPATIGNSDGPT